MVMIDRDHPTINHLVITFCMHDSIDPMAYLPYVTLKCIISGRSNESTKIPNVFSRLDLIITHQILLRKVI